MRQSKNKSCIPASRALTILLLFLFTSLLLSVPAAAAPKIREAEYEGRGKVEVSMTTKNIQYKNLKITVKDSAGKTVKIKFLNKDNDEVNFKILNCRQGTTYRYTLTGVRKKGEAKYSTLTGKIRVPKHKGSVEVKEVDYDASDSELSFEFFKKVYLSPSTKVSITRGGKSYASVWEKDGAKEFEVKVKKLTPGKVYRYRITGIKDKKTGSYTTISGDFTA